MKPGRFRLFANGLSGSRLVLAVTVFVTLTGNWAFYSRLLATYPPASGVILPLLTLPLALCATTLLLLAPVCVGRLTKPLLGAVLMLSAAAAYFMDSTGVVISDEMLDNVFQTHPAEAFDLLSIRLMVYLAILGLAPSYFVFRIPLQPLGWRAELLSRLKMIGLAVTLLAGVAYGFGGFYASFLREHKELRSYANPGYYLYSTIKYVKNRTTTSDDGEFVAIGADARIPSEDTDRELVILVVGETARADHFSLNGYTRETNPLLAKEKVISFTDFWACGTSTAVSVPCMFSALGREAYEEKRAKRQGNVLDVIQHAGAHVLWLDNNSDSKGVALRVPYENYRSEKINPVCDGECRDIGMLARLQEIIDSRPQGDIVIVLHAMGNHGPAYHKRYPPEFERFTPVCRSSDLNQCTREEIVNAYDNAILYTDYFLAKAIELLKHNDAKFETALFYLSDHGESLGENGSYLHGLPYALAPDAQLRVPALMWFGANFEEVDRPALEKKRHQRFTHDHLFHTLLGFLEIQTVAYKPELDILTGARKPERR